MFLSIDPAVRGIQREADFVLFIVIKNMDKSAASNFFFLFYYH